MNPPRSENSKSFPISTPGAEMKTAYKQWSQVLGLALLPTHFVPLSRSLLPSETLVSSSVNSSPSKAQWFTPVIA